MEEYIDMQIVQRKTKNKLIKVQCTYIFIHNYMYVVKTTHINTRR